jgi:hypothetical protein
MDLKTEITKQVLESMGLVADPQRVKKTIPIWWANPRKKTNGGLRLTDQGFECLQKADIKSYEIKFEKPLQYTNQLVINLDRYMDFPFHINSRSVHVFGEKMAVQLVLLSGNIQNYVAAKARTHKNLLTST